MFRLLQTTSGPLCPDLWMRQLGRIRVGSLFAPRWGVRFAKSDGDEADSTSGLPRAANSAHPPGANGKVEQQVGGL